MPKKPAMKGIVNNEIVFFISLLFITSVIIISFINLQIYSLGNIEVKKPNEDVFGASEYQSESQFWNNYLDSNPYYLPGYIELYRIESENGNYLKVEELKIKIYKLNPNLTLNQNN